MDRIAFRRFLTTVAVVLGAGLIAGSSFEVNVNAKLLSFNQTDFNFKWAGFFQPQVVPLTHQTPVKTVVQPVTHFTVQPVPVAVSTDDQDQSNPYTVGEAIQVEWHGSWWPAVVTAKSGNSYSIHYIGYGCNWDETLSANRMRHSEHTRQQYGSPRSGDLHTAYTHYE